MDDDHFALLFGGDVETPQVKDETRNTMANDHFAFPVDEYDVETPREVTEEKTNWRRRITLGLIYGAIGVGTIVGISYAITGSANPTDVFVPVDPPGPSEADRWDATAGLTLRVMNACDDVWTEFFDASISDWRESPALNLITSRITHEPECQPVRGRLKVCNGNYGDTDWQGLNTILLRNEVILHSVAKLNDDHKMDYDRKLYTMCHEIGHGFGLVHTDENHLNINRGDCMDYTTRPASNVRPGSHNLNLLVKLYGTPDQPLQEEEAVSVQGGNLRPNRNGGGRKNRWLQDEGGSNSTNSTNAYDDMSSDTNSTSADDYSEDSSEEDDEEVPLVILQEAQKEEDLCTTSYCTRFLGNGYRVEINKLVF